MINPYDFYITPEEYKIAAQNGINRKTLEDRISRRIFYRGIQKKRGQRK